MSTHMQLFCQDLDYEFVYLSSGTSSLILYTYVISLIVHLLEEIAETITRMAKI